MRCSWALLRTWPCHMEMQCWSMCYGQFLVIRMPQEQCSLLCGAEGAAGLLCAPQLRPAPGCRGLII